MKKINYVIFLLVGIFIFASNVNALSFENDSMTNTINYSYMKNATKSSSVNNEDGFGICDENQNPQLVASFKLVGIFLTIIKIIVPVILILMGTIDMTKAVISKDNDAIQKNLIVFLKRSTAGVLVFLAPNIILGIFHLVDGMDGFDSAYKTCVDCILGSSSCPDVKFIQGS